MTEDIVETIDREVSESSESLGNYLRRTRIEKGFELKDIVRDTKISLINLEAMEDDDFDALPSAAFTRGLYTLYSKALDIDPEDVFARLRKENEKTMTHNKAGVTPSMLIKEVSQMAERPAAPPTLLLGILFLAMVLLVSIGCWYYSINPATFLSEKLRGFQSEQTLPPEDSSTHPSVLENADKYNLSGFFPEDTQILVSIDNNSNQLYEVYQGQKLTWTAETSLDVTLPADANATLRLNGVAISLPAPSEDVIFLSLPSHVLD